MASKKGKKGSSGKPRQPQRGLGVAQLEKMRLQGQMAEYLPSLLQCSPHERRHLCMDDARAVRGSSWPLGSAVPRPSPFPGLCPNISMMVPNGAVQAKDIYGGVKCANALLGFPATSNGNATLPLLEQTTEGSSERDHRRAEHGRRCHTVYISLDSNDEEDAVELDLELRL